MRIFAINKFTPLGQNHHQLGQPTKKIAFIQHEMQHENGLEPFPYKILRTVFVQNIQNAYERFLTTEKLLAGVFCCLELLPKRFGQDLNPFSNKIFAVKFMQIAQSACKLLLQFMRGSLQAFFVFRQHSETQHNP